MSATVKLGTIEFKYLVEPKVIREFKRQMKSTAPWAFQLPPDIAPFVKRYTDATYHFVELVDGRIVKTRDFKKNARHYTSTIPLKIQKWNKLTLSQLKHSTEVENAECTRLGYLLTGLYISYLEDFSQIRIIVTGGGGTLMDCTMSCPWRSIRALEDLSKNLAYTIRKLAYGTVTGQWDRRYLQVIMEQFSRETMLGPGTRARVITHDTQFLPTVPLQKGYDEFHNSFVTIINKLKDFPTQYQGTYRGEGQLWAKPFNPTHDEKTLRTLAKWFHENAEHEYYRGIGFTQAMKFSPILYSHPELHAAVLSYTVYIGASDWAFSYGKTNLMDYILAFLKLNPSPASSHSSWINIYRAIMLFEEGKIEMFDAKRAGEQLNDLNKFAFGGMMKDSPNDKEVSFNRYRIWYLFRSLIKPTLEQLLSKK